MRPVRKNKPHLYKNGQPYENARDGLVSRLGLYCSYCERKLPTGIEVEHIQPKSLNTNLERDWHNFLLACKNCNTCKSTSNSPLYDWLIPDRDNTFIAFEYRQDGIIEVKQGINKQHKAKNTLQILNLNKKVRQVFDPNRNLIALDKRTQRMDAWILAKKWRDRWDNSQNASETLEIIKDAICDLSKENGFFSIWMKAFEGVTVIRNRLIDAFSGTRDSGCFDPVTTNPISPAPNPDNLQAGGKI